MSCACFVCLLLGARWAPSDGQRLQETMQPLPPMQLMPPPLPTPSFAQVEPVFLESSFDGGDGRK
jgi:hypothetical protein